MTGNFPTEIYKEARQWLEEDWQRVAASLQGNAHRFEGKRVLMTGAAGFLGFNFLHFFSHLNARHLRVPVSVEAADNYLRGRPRWLEEITALDPHIVSRRLDINRPWPDGDSTHFDFIIHAASVASPTFYRRYPLETLDANVIGLRNMLDLAHRTKCESFLFFSSSEIYGDPSPDAIPTKESYRGNVSCLGPRACYDESKRLGETLCYIYAHNHGLPIKIARPFNNYGPGLRMDDRRVLPDFCREVLSGRDVILHSDGSPTRTFCYSSDALAGYLLVLLSSGKGEPFNIGSDLGEISMGDLANLVVRVSNANVRVIREPSAEADYLTDNPTRRCPDISKARTLLGFVPQVNLETGLSRMLKWYRDFSEVDVCSTNGS